jgi:REP element-mobilizing transposase RayT
MIPNNLYHIYNRGNNKEKIFFNSDNYRFFIQKIVKHLKPHLEIMAYCLMPNHFHLMVQSREDLVTKKFSKDLRIMLSSYTRAINNEQNRTGSLFQQNSKIKSLEENSKDTDYPFINFQYIHQNPMKANLVKQFEDWGWSSFRDYAGMRNVSICNRELARKYLNLPKSAELFMKQAYGVQLIKDFDIED